MGTRSRQPDGSTLKVPASGARIQRLLDKENAVAGSPPKNPKDPDAPNRSMMKGEFARDPAKDIRDYIRSKK